jgi:hypothetical protein
VEPFVGQDKEQSRGRDNPDKDGAQGRENGASKPVDKFESNKQRRNRADTDISELREQDFPESSTAEASIPDIRHQMTTPASTAAGKTPPGDLARMRQAVGAATKETRDAAQSATAAPVASKLRR